MVLRTSSWSKNKAVMKKRKSIWVEFFDSSGTESNSPTTKSSECRTLEVVCFRGCTEDVETLADRIVLPVQPDISQSLKDWLVNIIRGN